ncbi:O-antigen ligase [Clostridium sp.]|uniref:O-antigen ligase family protein n=1 Tax=Clostridium sp. TaxID=1506 RepID=UPI001D857F0E|nr:O-antigen ligase family protein [Clostridium sp.]MBS5937896.1 O-antigen ligase family protein [Clostridium sp.]
MLILTVIFSIDNYKDKKELNKEIDIYSYFYIASTFIFSTISTIFVAMKLNIEKLIVNADGVEELITFKGVFNNENAFGISAALSILITLYMISKAKNSKVKIIFYINLVIQFIALIISGGRSGYLALLSLAFIIAFIYIKNNIVRALLIILPVLSFVFVFTLDSSTLHYIFTGREYIWIAAIRIIKFAFFSGIGTSNTIPTLIQNQPADLIGVTKGGIHNIYMEVTTTNGFIATFMLILFIASVIISGIYIISKMDSNKKISYTLLLSILFAIPVINLMESSLVYIISFISLIYWFYSGHFIAIINKEKDRY